MTPRLTVNYGLRYDTTFGLFTASGRSQLENPAYLTLKALDIPLVTSAPQDYRHAFAPRIGVAYTVASPLPRSSARVSASFTTIWRKMAGSRLSRQ